MIQIQSLRITSIRTLRDKIEEQRKHLIRLEERNQELAKVVTNVFKDLTFYQNYSGAEMYRTDFKTAMEMRQAMYRYKDMVEGS
jgi:N-glycosylase/DNA lyase